jgi:hypothetical protein
LLHNVKLLTFQIFKWILTSWIGLDIKKNYEIFEISVMKSG